MVSNMFSDTPEPDGKKSNKIEPKKRDDITRLHHSVICRMLSVSQPCYHHQKFSALGSTIFVIS
jgi:hypothetical protein